MSFLRPDTPTQTRAPTPPPPPTTPTRADPSIAQAGQRPQQQTRGGTRAGRAAGSLISGFGALDDRRGRRRTLIGGS